MAYSVLTSLKIDQLPVDPLQILMRCNNTSIHTYDEAMTLYGMTDRALFKLLYMEDQDAITVRRLYDNGRSVYEMFYDSHAYPPRMRFTFAHELAHIILGHSREDLVEEAEADYFASQLLAPHPVFVLLTINGYDMSPDGISKTFHISRAAASASLARPKHKRNMDRDYSVQELFAPFIYEHGPNKLYSEVESCPGQKDSA